MSDSPPSHRAESLRHPADMELVRDCVNGDPDAKALVLERLTCVPRYLATANRKSGYPLEPQDLSDLSQDMLILIWQRIATFEGRATLESWAWSYCRFGFWNRARMNNRRKRLFGTDLESIVESTTSSTAFSEAMDYSQLEAALNSIPESEREVVRLKHFEGLKFREIGERLNLSPNTVKGRYYRGLRELKARLEAMGQEGK